MIESLYDKASIKIENFEGPLDLLLNLIREKKLSIFKINIADIATQYLKIIEMCKNSNIDLASEYLVLAATLLQLKVKTVLDNPEEKEETEKIKRSIFSRLIELHQFKKIGKYLRKLEEERSKIFIKDVSSYKGFEKEVDESELYGHMSISKIIKYLKLMFERTYAEKKLTSRVEFFNLSPAERRKELLDILRKEEPSFKRFFTLPSINHFMVTMITVLDMARKDELLLYQDKQFGNIEIKRGENLQSALNNENNIFENSDEESNSNNNKDLDEEKNNE